jgi:hypothetical protein
MDFWVIAYILLCVCLGGGIVTILMRRQQTIASMLVLVLLILVFIFFGLRWFPGGNLNGTKPAKVPWPPIVNMCPDFMVTSTMNGKVYCYDSNNVYNLKEVPSPTAPLVKIDANKPETAYLMKDPNSPSPVTLTKNLGTILSGSNEKYLRWEGVWDGYSATPEKAPGP